MPENVEKEEVPSIQASEWYRPGDGMMYRRSSLPPTHKESWFSLWFKKYGSLEDFPWESMGPGWEGGPPEGFPWRAFGLDPFKECPNCGHVHKEKRELPPEAYGW
jgi:hypothetical protein